MLFYWKCNFVLDDFTIALWLKSELTSKPWIDPKVMCILRGHNGGVTCLAFSPNEKELLSGGKDQVLGPLHIYHRKKWKKMHYLSHKIFLS